MIKIHHPRNRAERRELHQQKDIKFENKETVKETKNENRNVELDNQPLDHR